MKALFALMLAIPAISTAQTALEWQVQHPDGVLIAESTYAAMSAKERALLGSEVLILDSDIREAEQLAISDTPSAQPVSAEAEAVKTWLAFHQGIPVISYTEFLSADEAERELLISQHALIFQGEKLTLSDIENYHY